MPVRSHMHAATTPPGRTTRRISAMPVGASFMKVTTSCASAASNDSSGHGSSSAGAARTSTAGRRRSSAATKGGDGSAAATSTPRRDELGGQRAGPRADVEDALSRLDAGEVREYGASRIEYRPMKLS